jgi:hypothetical protein
MKPNLIIVFEDHGQDFLEWEIDANGIVVDSRPFQRQIWSGNFLPFFDSLKPGDYADFLVTREGGRHACIKYPITEVRHAHRPQNRS